jgi:Family of unknown function (DUF6279)
MVLVRNALIAALCVVLSLLGGCSALRVGYNQADWLAYRWLDNYADFDDAQALRVRDAIVVWFAWHRKTQLIDYADLLLRIDADVLADTSPERVCRWWGEIRTRLDGSVTQAVPAIADLAATLTPAQLESIERRYGKSNAAFRNEFMQPDRAKRSSEAVKRVLGRSESLYDGLDPFQRERLEQWVADSPYDPTLAFEERRRRQQDALQMLRLLTGEPVDSATAQGLIRGWLQRIDRSPREVLRLHAERTVQHNCRIAANVHNSTSPAQRRTASKKLRAWAADLRILASDAANECCERRRTPF